MQSVSFSFKIVVDLISFRRGSLITLSARKASKENAENLIAECEAISRFPHVLASRTVAELFKTFIVAVQLFYFAFFLLLLEVNNIESLRESLPRRLLKGFSAGASIVLLFLWIVICLPLNCRYKSQHCCRKDRCRYQHCKRAWIPFQVASSCPSRRAPERLKFLKQFRKQFSFDV